MAHDLFLEEGGYFCFCHVEQLPAGEWSGWVNFERKRDHDQGLARIPGMRHRVTGTFSTEGEAVQACAQYAQLAVVAGETGL